MPNFLSLAYMFLAVLPCHMRWWDLGYFRYSKNVQIIVISIWVIDKLVILVKVSGFNITYFWGIIIWCSIFFVPFNNCEFVFDNLNCLLSNNSMRSYGDWSQAMETVISLSFLMLFLFFVLFLRSNNCILSLICLLCSSSHHSLISWVIYGLYTA